MFGHRKHPALISVSLVVAATLVLSPAAFAQAASEFRLDKSGWQERASGESGSGCAWLSCLEWNRWLGQKPAGFRLIRAERPQMQLLAQVEPESVERPSAAEEAPAEFSEPAPERAPEEPVQEPPSETAQEEPAQEPPAEQPATAEPEPQPPVQEPAPLVSDEQLPSETPAGAGAEGASPDESAVGNSKLKIPWWVWAIAGGLALVLLAGGGGGEGGGGGGGGNGGGGGGGGGSGSETGGVGYSW